MIIPRTALNKIILNNRTRILQASQRLLSTKPEFNGFETKSIHAGTAPDPATNARVVPIYQTSSFVFNSADHASSLFNLEEFGNIYSRLTNPTVTALENRLAALENGVGAVCTSSGHSAQLLALLALMDKPGDKIVAANKLYGGTIQQFSNTIKKKFSWGCDFVNIDDLDQVRNALKGDNVKALFCESVTNPEGNVVDLSSLADLAHEAGVPLIVDSTLASPYLCKPIDHGADIVIHSTTKFISGHGNSMGGCIIDSGNFDWSAQGDKYPSLTEPEDAYHGLKFHETFGNLAFTVYTKAIGLRDIGACLSPMNAFLTLSGCETLPLRMQRHVDNALQVAQWLDSDPRVQWVSYAGLPSSPYHDLAKKYTPKGPGSVFNFGVQGGYDAGIQCVEKVELFSHLANVGDTRSLILHPASTTHRQLSDKDRAIAGAGDDVVRVSIGLESVDDIIADLDYALG